MFKSRSYVLGIGTGIIVGALLLQIMSVRTSAPGQQPGIAPDEMDPQKLKVEASKYYQVFDMKTKVYTQTELDTAVQKVKEEADKLAAAKPQNQPQATTPVAAQKLIIYIQPNLDATAVSELLLKSGLITNRKDFISELEKQGGNTKIQIGYHVFEGTMDIPKIVANLLTIQ